MLASHRNTHVSIKPAALAQPPHPLAGHLALARLGLAIGC
jgi:hypothetical protein